MNERLHVRAVLARRGLAPQHLTSWWSPDTDRMVNPLNDPDTQMLVQRTLKELWEHGTIPAEVQS